MKFPLVDLLFFAFVGFYAYRGFFRGLVREGLDLLGFILGAAIALKFYSVPAAVLQFFGMGQGWSNVLGGILLFALFLVGAALLANRIHAAPQFANGVATPVKVGGAVFASIWSALFAAFIMVVLTVIPTPAVAQAAVRDSLVGHTLLSANSPVYGALEGYAKHEARNLLFYLRQYFAQLQPTQEGEAPEEEYFQLQPSSDIEVDAGAEKAILDLVNRERGERGLSILLPHEPIQAVARNHSADMYRRGYFAHLNPDGMDPFERMEGGGVVFTLAGENLALAPTIEMVHRGLMNSPRHRDNILKLEFTDLGVGIFKGPYGLMVTQNFCSGCRDQ